MRSDVQMQIFVPGSPWSLVEGCYRCQIQHICKSPTTGEYEQGILDFHYSTEMAQSIVGGVCVIIDQKIQEHHETFPDCFIYNPLTTRYERPEQ